MNNILESLNVKIFNHCKEGRVPMKSCFLLLAISSVLITPAFAQSPKRVSQKKVQQTKTTTKKTTTTTTTVAPAAAPVVVTDSASKSTFDKFYDNLKISYFGVITSSNLESWDQSQASVSPEWGISTDDSDPGVYKKTNYKNADTWPVNLWNQISFNYNFGWKYNLVVNPRWMIPLGNTGNMADPEDRSFVMLDDVLVGLQGVAYKSQNGKFVWFTRNGIRVPTSHASRNSNNRGFGTVSQQLEAFNIVSYDFNPKWQIGMYSQIRMWVYEQRYNPSRLRIYSAPYVQYTLNDTQKVQVFYENIVENDRKWKSINGQKFMFKDTWQNGMIGFSQDINSKFNVMPYISAYVNDVPFSMRSVWFGAWISYQIK